MGPRCCVSLSLELGPADRGLLDPWLGILVYVIARGKGMQERQLEQAKEMQAAQTEYINSVAISSSSATDQISSAKTLLDQGAITQAEFDALKTKAPAG